jgi:hypothetical protein
VKTKGQHAAAATTARKLGTTHKVDQALGVVHDYVACPEPHVPLTSTVSKDLSLVGIPVLVVPLVLAVLDDTDALTRLAGGTLDAQAGGRVAQHRLRVNVKLDYFPSPKLMW